MDILNVLVNIYVVALLSKWNYLWTLFTALEMHRFAIYLSHIIFLLFVKTLFAKLNKLVIILTLRKVLVCFLWDVTVLYLHHRRRREKLVKKHSCWFSETTLIIKITKFSYSCNISTTSFEATTLLLLTYAYNIWTNKRITKCWSHIILSQDSAGFFFQNMYSTLCFDWFLFFHI